jgi:hypothetical protein
MDNLTVGIISDTHGKLRPEATALLEGSDMIFHIGDVGIEEILDDLGKIAPVHAVRGNVDYGGRLSRLPYTEMIDFGNTTFYLIHILEELDIEPVAAGVNVVLFGHSHQPTQYYRDGVLYLNPGSAGPRRFNLPITLAKIYLSDNALVPVIYNLATGQPYTDLLNSQLNF